MLLAGDRACPPAKIGDIQEYQGLLSRLEKAGSDREKILAEHDIAGTFDPSYCDIRAINDKLHGIF
jgi:hypothetical protein